MRGTCPGIDKAAYGSRGVKESCALEKWNEFLIGHGAAMALKERLLDESDQGHGIRMFKCGMIATLDKRRNITICYDCGCRTDIHPVEMSYAFKLLLDEIISAWRCAKIVLEDAV